GELGEGSDGRARGELVERKRRGEPAVAAAAADRLGEDAVGAVAGDLDLPAVGDGHVAARLAVAAAATDRECEGGIGAGAAAQHGLAEDRVAAVAAAA